MRSDGPYRIACLVRALCLCVAAWLAPACRTTAPLPARAPTRVETLISAYPDLRSGRFAVIADFEDPRHMGLFRPAGDAPLDRPMFSPRRGRPETGTTCLLVPAGRANDTIVISDIDTEKWHLKRDWRPFDLLLLSVRAPRAGMTLRIVVSAGPEEDRRASGATVPLVEGWTTARVDLAEIAERIPLDDVREMRISIDGASRPVDVPVDDIILTESRQDFLGDSAKRDGRLYVQRIGRRWRMGACEADRGFEITFANGRIVEWYNTGTDPNRLRNLVRGASLGPSPTVVGPTGVSEDDFRRFGTAVLTQARILEMNPVRVILAADWRFVDDPQVRRGALADRPHQRWVYTIYPTGQIYFAVETSAASPSWTAPQLGLAVTLADPPDDPVETKVVQASSDAGGNASIPYATARRLQSDTVLLYAVADAGGRLPISVASVEPADGADDSGWMSLVAVGERQSGAVHAWTGHLLLGQSSRVPPEEASARVNALARPSPPTVELGSLLQTATGKTGAWDPATGCYNVAPKEGGVRLVFNGRERPYFSPCVRVVDSPRRQAWVYVDDQVVEPVARDAQGHVILQLLGTIRDRKAVEVLFRRPLSEGS